MVADAFHIAQIGNVSSYRVAHRVELDGAAHRLDHREELLGLIVERGADVLQQRLERPQLEWRHPCCCSPPTARVLQEPMDVGHGALHDPAVGVEEQQRLGADQRLDVQHAQHDRALPHEERWRVAQLRATSHEPVGTERPQVSHVEIGGLGQQLLAGHDGVALDRGAAAAEPHRAVDHPAPHPRPHRCCGHGVGCPHNNWD